MAGTAGQPYMYVPTCPGAFLFPLILRSYNSILYFVALQALRRQIVVRVYAHPRHSLGLLLGAVGAINAPHSPGKARPFLQDYNFTSQ